MNLSNTRHRTHRVEELLRAPPGSWVRIAGWVHRKRILGAIVFVEIRDASGVVQCVIEPTSPAFRAAEALHLEAVVAVCGDLVSRAPQSVNEKLATGAIEVRATGVEVLSDSLPLPFAINAWNDPPEELRLEYRFLDLRRERLRNNILLRARVIARLRELLWAKGFVEFQTPILTASSPEGARDFLVPSRLHRGKFYALPQAPQQFKQLLMVSGFDRYFQIAPCFRDEDARADRSPGEFYQLDIEMAFVTEDEIFETVEAVLHPVFAEFSSRKVPPPPFTRISYRDAVVKYATDKPDLRAVLEYIDVSAIATEIEAFAPFAQNGIVRALRAPGAARLPRSFWDRLAEIARGSGARFGYLVLGSERGTLAKAPPMLRDELARATGAQAGDALLVIGSPNRRPAREIAELRCCVARELGSFQERSFRFCWVVDFPMYERDRQTGQVVFSHNPFSMPQCGMAALDGDPESVLAHQYDLVCNGVELSSGAIRNHSPEIMLRAFAVAGYTATDVERRFGGLLRAFRYGAPPHGGIAPGIDRIVMLLAEEANLREVIAFPMTQNAEDLLMKAPSVPGETQLVELGLRLVDDDR